MWQHFVNSRDELIVYITENRCELTDRITVPRNRANPFPLRVKKYLHFKAVCLLRLTLLIAPFCRISDYP